MKKIEFTADLDFNGYWKDDYEGITNEKVIRRNPMDDFEYGWGYDIVEAECEAYEDISYTDSERKHWYLESVSTIADVASPRTWSTEKPAKVEIVDWK